MRIFLNLAKEYAASLPTPEERKYAEGCAARMLGSMKPDPEGVRESRRTVIEAMILALRAKALTRN